MLPSFPFRSGLFSADEAEGVSVVVSELSHMEVLEDGRRVLLFLTLLWKCIPCAGVFIKVGRYRYLQVGIHQHRSMMRRSCF